MTVGDRGRLSLAILAAHADGQIPSQQTTVHLSPGLVSLTQLTATGWQTTRATSDAGSRSFGKLSESSAENWLHMPSGRLFCPSSRRREIKPYGSSDS